MMVVFTIPLCTLADTDASVMVHSPRQGGPLDAKVWTQRKDLVSITAMRWAKRSWPTTTPDNTASSSSSGGGNSSSVYSLLAVGTRRQVHVIRFHSGQGRPVDEEEGGEDGGGGGRVSTGMSTSFRPEGSPLLSFDCPDVSALEWLPLANGDGLAVGALSGRVTLVELSGDHTGLVSSLQEIWPPDHRNVTSLMCSWPQPLEANESPVLAMGKSSHVVFWDVSKGRCCGQVGDAHMGCVTGMSWACGPEGGRHHLITGGLGGGAQGM